MKAIIGTLVVVVAALVLASSSEVGATGADADRYTSCKNSCQASVATICEAAYAARDRGQFTTEKADKMCECGVLVCANVCVREYGEPAMVRPPPAICIELGVTE